MEEVQSTGPRYSFFPGDPLVGFCLQAHVTVESSKVMNRCFRFLGEGSGAYQQAVPAYHPSFFGLLEWM